MGGRGGKSGTGGESRLARNDASVVKQVAAARDQAAQGQRGLPFTDTHGGVLNRTEAYNESMLRQKDAQYLQDNMAWGNSLTAEERQAISAWNTPGVYSQITSKIMAGQALSPSQEKIFNNLSSAIDKSVTSENMTVWRGIKSNTSIEDVKAMVGKTWSNKGSPVATTLQWERAAHFTGNPAFGGNTSEGTMYKITVPKGSKGAYLNAGKAGVLNEHELLLSPKSVFRVTGYSREKSKAGYDYSGGATYNKEYTVIHMVYLGEK